MISIKKLSIRMKLFLLTGVAIFACLTLALWSFSTTRMLSNSAKLVEVNGPVYKKIVQGKDIIADILPPPEYILETYLVAFQLLENSDSSEQGELLKKYDQLKNDYNDRHNYWIKDLKDPQSKEDKLLSEGLIKFSYDPAMSFYKLIDEQYIPAIKAGNKDVARKLLMEKLKPEYLTHRKYIDQVVDLATKRNSADEKNAKVLIDSVAVNVKSGLSLMIIVSLGLIAA